MLDKDTILGQQSKKTSLKSAQELAEVLAGDPAGHRRVFQACSGPTNEQRQRYEESSVGRNNQAMSQILEHCGSNIPWAKLCFHMELLRNTIPSLAVESPKQIKAAWVAMLEAEGGRLAREYNYDCHEDGSLQPSALHQINRAKTHDISRCITSLYDEIIARLEDCSLDKVSWVCRYTDPLAIEFGDSAIQKAP